DWSNFAQPAVTHFRDKDDDLVRRVRDHGCILKAAPDATSPRLTGIAPHRVASSTATVKGDTASTPSARASSARCRTRPWQQVTLKENRVRTEYHRRKYLPSAPTGPCSVQKDATRLPGRIICLVKHS